MALPERTITVFPVSDRVEEELFARCAESGGASFARGLWTVRKLVSELVAAAGLRPLAPAAAELLAARVAPAASAGTALQGVAAEPGFAAAFLSIYDALRVGGCGAAELAHLARELPGLAGGRARGIAAVARAYEEALAAQGSCDEAGAHLLSADLLATAPLPPELRRSAGVALVDVIDVPVALARLLQALAGRLPVAVALPELTGRPELAPALELLSRTLELEAPLVAQRQRLYGGGRLARFQAALFDPDAVPAPDAPVTLREADDPTAELRAVVSRVRELLEAGVAPDDVCVAVRALPRHRARLGAALDAARIPWRDRRGSPAAEAPPCALALSLVELSERGLPREGLSALLTSRYVAASLPATAELPVFPARRLAALLRDAGSRNGAGEGHARRLAAHARALARKASFPREQQEAAQAARAAEWLAGILPALKLPRAATLAEHGAALLAALELLRVPELAAADAAGPDPALRATARAAADAAGPTVPLAGLDAAVDAALARDQAALRTLRATLAALADAARQVGQQHTRFSLGRFHELLGAGLRGATLPPRGPRGGAVLLAEAKELSGRCFPHVVIPLLCDGSFPLRRAGEPLLDEEDRDALNRAAGRPILRSRSAEEPLFFALSCAAARESLTLTWARTDGDGRDTIPSPFLAAATAALGGVRPVRVPAAVVAPAVGCSSLDELLARAALCAAGGSPAPGDPPAAALLAAVRADPLLGPRLRTALAGAGTGRGDGGRLGAAATSGVLDSLEHAARSFGPGVAWASSVTALEDYAACPFRFLAKRVLRLPEREQEDDDLDARERGTLLHEVLAAAFRALAAAGLLPLLGGDRASRETAVALTSCEETLDAWESRERTGPAPLWALKREDARVALQRVLEAERHAGSTAVPVGFELPFGEEGQAPLLLRSPDGSQAIALRGRIDRLDETPGGGPAAVIDYKSGRVGGKVVGAEQGVVSFQLPVYAAWAARRPGVTSVDGALLSLRDGQRSRSLAEVCLKAEVPLATLLEGDPERRALARAGAAVAPAVGAGGLARDGDRNLADAAWSFFGAIRAGRFDVLPHDPGKACRYCALGTVCRIEPGDERDEEEQP